ncbi:cuticle protein AM1159-like [Oratosquilla oratoria]|uniref:cuticle protein AM1159-like n=1 Tax=Oratosquilla oratoria TaxID=337810 RepID=UPI003F7614BF
MQHESDTELKEEECQANVVLLLCCVLSVEGRPSSHYALAKDERTVNTAEGEHTLDFEVLNLQKRKEIGKQDDGQSFSGSFDFVTVDGEAFEIMYVADGRGFLPQGEHLPVAPALPYHRVQPFPRSHKRLQEVLEVFVFVRNTRVSGKDF